MDLDFFDHKRKHRGQRHWQSHDEHDDRDDDHRSYRDDEEPRRRSDGRYLASKPRWRGRHEGKRGRRAHPHVFAWLLLGGGMVLLAAAVMVIASSLGLWGAISDGYFAISRAVLPATWHDEWAGLPGIAHVAMVGGALFVAAGVVGELLD